MSFSEDKYRKRVYGLHEQAAHIRLICADFKYRVRRGELVGTGSMQPAPNCATYVFTLTYRVGTPPKVTITDPPLRCRDDQTKIPHTYGPDEPCVFRPGLDWSQSDLIATTVIPWLATWLFYYEIWHATGEWYGGGEHPDSAQDEPVTSESTQSEK